MKELWGQHEKMNRVLKCLTVFFADNLLPKLNILSSSFFENYGRFPKGFLIPRVGTLASNIKTFFFK